MPREMFRISDIDKIISLIEEKSLSMTNYVLKNDKSKFILYYKYLTHSDLPTFGKATRQNEHHKNLLYYLTTKEMLDVEKRLKKPFETAHQSNIGVPSSFWVDLGMGNPRDLVRVSDDELKKVNNFADVFLVNDSLKYFNKGYTQKVFDSLGKSTTTKQEWSDNEMNVVVCSTEDFTEIKLTQKVHGLGFTEDSEFRKLRHNMFKNDILLLIIEVYANRKKLFIMPYKNPKFFTIIGESNTPWEEYLRRKIKRNEREGLFEEIPECINRSQQDKWRNMLAEEMMNYTVNDNEVFCPFTYVSTSFENIGTLYRASHIKEFSKSTESEKFNINNGLLLVANADALFDKHLITIDENKNLIFSFLLESDYKLKSQLMLNQPIFKDILNGERMKYIAHHRAVFNSKEGVRKKNKID